MSTEVYDKINALVDTANHILIVQADNPDGDSLASSLALETLLEQKGKQVTMYCGVAVPSYLRYMSGWDRVVDQLPSQFDMSIIVDTASVSLLETLQKQRQLPILKSKKCIVLDHHTAESTIDFATIECIEPAVSTGELIYRIASHCKWDVHDTALCEFIAYSILSDSLGLTSEAVTSDSVKLVSQLIDNGVVLAKLDAERKKLQKKSQGIFKYKARLMERVEFHSNDRIATVHIPWDEIESYSHEYNPSILVIDEMRMVDKVAIAVAFKTYPDGKITAKLRANYGYRICDTVAEHFGGGGHPYAAGFKLHKAGDIESVTTKLIAVIEAALLDEGEQS